MTTTIDLDTLRDMLRAHLLGEIVPFWEAHGFQSGLPGIDTCMDDHGKLLSTDRYLWSQLRAVWTFAALHRRIEPREEWLDHARNIADFALEHGRDHEGHWCFRLDHTGEILTGATSIFADGFALLGLTELFRASGESRYLEEALDTAQRVQNRLTSGQPLPVAPYETPEGHKAHAVSMIFSHAFDQLSEASPEPWIREAAEFHCHEVMDYYLREEDGLVREYITLDNQLQRTPEGRVIVPGHAIESMWFQLLHLRKSGDQERVRRALDAIQRHFEFGWDPEYGGLFLARDAEGHNPPAWAFHDAKLWWPATEAMVSLLLAHRMSGESWCLESYQRIHEYAFRHYPSPETGEWTQRLDRQGKPFREVVALPVKDPFHLPRSLILSLQILGETE